MVEMWLEGEDEVEEMEEEKVGDWWEVERGNHNSVLLWPGYPPTCKTMAFHFCFFGFYFKLSSTWLRREERVASKCFLPGNFGEEHSSKNPVDDIWL